MTLTETLVKKELEKQTGKRWERKVFNENGKNSVIFVAEEDNISPCFNVNELENALKGGKDITITQYVKEFLSKPQVSDIKASLWERMKYNIEEFWINNSLILSIIVIVLFGITGCTIMSSLFDIQKNMLNEVDVVMEGGEQEWTE